MTAAERKLLTEVAGWIARLEEGLARDGGRTSPAAEKLRRLIAEVSRPAMTDAERGVARILGRS